MNGFEPLRRRIIDYTDAGQWSVVYDGPVEGCEAEQLKAENAKLRELVRDIADHIKHGDGFGIDRGWMLDRMRELGVEVEP